MFREVQECSGMFHVPVFIDGHRTERKWANSESVIICGVAVNFLLIYAKVRNLGLTNNLFLTKGDGL